MRSHIAVAAALSAVLAGPALGQDHQHAPSGGPEKIGTVAFQTSCAASAQPTFNKAVALLHSFEFARAIEAFDAALQLDPACAMTRWGVALARWGNPFAPGVRPAAALRQGREAIESAVRIGARTPRESAYIAAARRLYESYESIEQPVRVRAYRDAMGEVAVTYRDDSEAAIFHALAIAAAAPPTDKTHADLLKAGAMLEAIVKTQPDHPGLAHYIIHSYDVPPLADRALEAARSYAQIAPSVPHALHMPSHTFTRVGYWQESIDTNVASAEAARREGSTAEELHAMDYRTYAYLQTGQDAAARALLASLPEVRARFDPDAVGSAAPGSAGVFALAAIPARYALERGAWDEAARLVPAPSRFLFPDTLTYFANAVGAARTGNAAAARQAAGTLASIAAKLVEQKEAYWADQADIARAAALAWASLAEGDAAAAVDAMRAAAAREDATEKSAVTPGPLAPARELLGEMLLSLRRPAEALTEFETTLKTEPNRFRTLAGAAKAASLTGDTQKARQYYEMLLKICARADTPGRPELAEARAFVSRR